MDIPVEVYRELGKLSNIAGIKEASNSIQKTGKIIAACDLPVWSGNDDMTVPAVALGAKGVISVLSNVSPLKASLMTQAALAGDFDTAACLHKNLLPLMDALFCDVNPIPVKAAMGLIGFDCGDCRLPLGKLSEEKLSILRSVIA